MSWNHVGVEEVNPRFVKVKEADKPKPPEGRWPLEGEAFSKLNRLIKEKGLALPVFIGRDGYVLSGHYRLWAAQTVGLKKIPVVEVGCYEDILKWIERQKVEGVG